MTYNAKVPKRKKTEYVIIHCSGDTNEGLFNIKTGDINMRHKRRGKKCIGYHYVIEENGDVIQGRDLEVIGSHAEEFNDISVGICMVGGRSPDHTNIAKDDFNDNQHASLRALLYHIKSLYPHVKIMGHNELPGFEHKTCPCFNVNKIYGRVFND